LKKTQLTLKFWYCIEFEGGKNTFPCMLVTNTYHSWHTHSWAGTPKW